MRRSLSFVRSFKPLLASLAVLMLGAAWMQTASAGCGQFQPLAKKLVSELQSSSTFGTPRFIRTGLWSVSDESESNADTRLDGAIVGLWHFKYIALGNAGIPDGTKLDGGNTTWYADGNELTSSEVRAPDTGSICLGIWKQTGKNTYVLNHIGLSWDPVNNVAIGPAFIKQSVTLQPGGNTYTGTFTVTQYLTDGVTVAMSAKGEIIATRVTIGTDTQVP